MSNLPRSLLAAALFFGAATAATAQTYPSQSETPVTDDAELLSPVEEAELATRLIEIEQDGNVDIAVVTLISTALYTGGDDIDVYAQGLIESWDMGATTDGRAVLFLVFRDDGEMAVEYGSGFDAGQTAETQAIIDDDILPAFSEGDFPEGIRSGVEGLASRVISVAAADTSTPETPASTTEEATDGEGGGTALYWIGGIVAALVAVIVGANRRAAAKLAATPCANCGATGLTRERVTLVAATEQAPGQGEVRTTCPSCGHVETEPFTISKKSPPKSDDDGKAQGGKGSW